MSSTQTSHDPDKFAELERILRSGLSVGGPQLDQLVGWLLHGTPEGLRVTGLDGTELRLMTRGHGDRIIELVEATDVTIAWRIGIMSNWVYWSGFDSMEPLRGLVRLFDRYWPRDHLADEMFDRVGMPAENRLKYVLNWNNWNNDSGVELRSCPSFGRLIAAHPQFIHEYLVGPVDGLASFANAISDAPGEALAAHAHDVAWLLTSASKKRQHAGSKIASNIDYRALSESLKNLATQGSPDIRVKAIQAMIDRVTEDHRGDLVSFCEQNFVSDRSAKVRSVVQSFLNPVDDPQTNAYLSAAGESEALLPDIDYSMPTNGARKAYDGLFEQAFERHQAQYERELEWHRNPPPARQPSTSTPPRPWPAPRPPVPFDRSAIEEGWTFICEGEPVSESARHEFGRVQARMPDVEHLGIVHTFRLMSLFGISPDALPTGQWAKSANLTGEPSLLEIQAVADHVGVARLEMLTALRNANEWPESHTAAWARAVLPELLEAIGIDGPAKVWPRNLDRYCELVGLVEVLPLQARNALLADGLGKAKAKRELARKALKKATGLTDDVLGFVKSAKYYERAAAASWLVEIGDTKVVPALHAAAKTEKHDVALGAILSALERFGEPIDVFVEPSKLLDKATRGLAKRSPAAAAWIPFDSLPRLRWLDDSIVEPVIVQWLVHEAVRLKSAAPSPMVRRYFEQMKTKDVEDFASVILELWIHQDTKLPGQNEAVGSGDSSHAASHVLAARFLGNEVASAVSSKGILSLVAAGGGPAVVAPAETYIRTWYGVRASQCRSLIEMLAWTELPGAIQLVLSIGTRFRTKGLQKEAALQAELLAERKSWTVEDLAYRTVPTGGFNLKGMLALDCGERSFTLQLDDDLKVSLLNDKGKSIKALPGPRKDEDESILKAAKKQISVSRKVAKTSLKQQPQRLHEAMCVQRSFDADDFDRYILQHPIMSRLSTRLVWVGVTPAGSSTAFRPVSDGTLVDIDDNELPFARLATVRLAHEAIDGSDLGGAWSRHFSDYEVSYLFPQFGRSDPRTVDPGQRQQNDCRGAIIDDRRLRSVCNQLGFTFGSAEDGGMVHYIGKRFASSGLEAHIEVQGLYAVLMSQDVALGSVCFVYLDQHEPVQLSDVPPVLLAEVLADVEQIVAAGEGVVDNWETRVAR